MQGWINLHLICEMSHMEEICINGWVYLNDSLLKTIFETALFFIGLLPRSLTKGKMI